MAGKKTGKRLLTWVLVLVMALSLLPLNALADELVMAGDPDTSRTQSAEENGAYLVKSATKVGDTYQIQLESWVTGKVEQTTGSAPLDIVLVLDQSGSMAKNGKLESLKTAVRDFVAAINKDAEAHDVEHRIAIVGFASDKTDGGSNWGEDGAWYNTGIFVNGALKNYQTYQGQGEWEKVYLGSDSTPEDGYEYSAYLHNYSIFRTKIEYNAEKPEWGYRSGVLGNKWNPITPKTDENDTDSNHVQVERRAKKGYMDLTEDDYRDALVKSSETSISTAIDNLSASGATRASYGMEMANNVFENNALRDGSSRVVVFFTDGEPGQDGYETDEAGRAIAQAHATKHTYDAKVFSVGMFDKTPSKNSVDFMNYVSSNYPDANASKPSHFWEDWTITSGDPDADKYYMTVKGGDLSTVFEKISGSILTSDVTAGKDTVLTDKLSKYFDFDGVTVENGTVTGVTVQKQKYNGDGQAWGEPESVDNVSVALDPATKTVTVKGFDYSDKENVVTDGTNGTNPSGYKLVVTFNVKPDTSYENWDVSGRYPTNSGKATLAKVGEEPFATVDSPDAAVETYQVTYKPGNGTSNEYADQYYLNGATTKVKDNTFKAPDGYDFDCWKDESGKTYQVGDEITFDKSDVTLTAQWKLIEAPDLSVTKTVTKVGETTVTAGEDIPTAYPGDEIEWTITVTNSGNAEGNFTLKETLSDITVKDAAGSPVTLSNNEWRGTVPANDSVIYTVTYTVKASDVTDNGLVNTVTMNGDGEESSDPVPTAQKYTVTGTIDNGGTVTNSPQKVPNGKASEAMTFTPANGYEIASVKVKTGNDTETVTDFDKQSYTYAAQENVTADITVTVETTKRTDLSYTVNYLEKDTNDVLHTAKTVENQTFGDTVKSADKKIDIVGYNYVSATPASLTIGTGENVINLYYTKRSDLSYTVKYVDKITGSEIQKSVVKNDKTFGDTITGASEKVSIANYTYVEANPDRLTIGTDATKNVITLYYTKDAPTPGTFDFNDVDHDGKNTPAITKTVKGNVGKNFKETFAVTVKGADRESAATMSAPSYTGEAKVTYSDLKNIAFRFNENDKLTFCDRGTYTYTVWEVPSKTSRMSYDTTEYTLKINVKLDADSNTYQVESWQFTPGNREYTTALNIVNTYRTYHPSTPSKPTLNTGDHYAYVMGYPDGTVRPNGSITRAEVSTILFRLLSDKTRDEYFTTESSFTDVKAGAWYNNSIATLEKAGVIVDTAKGGAFRPNEAITRAELAAMLAQFSDAKPVKGVKFSDVSAEHWAYEAIAIAAKMGWIEGYPDGTFRPDATITRAEMMTLVNRALERVPSDEDHLLSKRVMLTFPDCKSGDWFYIAVQEATNSHTYERAATEKNGDEQWTALRANRDWTLLEK